MSQKYDVSKSLGPFDVWKVPESQNMENKEICFTVLKPNENGLFRKPPESMANKFRSS
jgi:hypothetical protein